MQTGDKNIALVEIEASRAGTSADVGRGTDQAGTMYHGARARTRTDRPTRRGRKVGGTNRMPIVLNSSP